MGELQPLWNRTVRSPPSVNRARNRSSIDWVFWDSCIGPYLSPVHQHTGPQDLHLGPLIAHTTQERVVRQGGIRVPRDVDGLHRESVEQVEEAADVVRVRVAHDDAVQRVNAPAAQEVHDVRALLRSSRINEIALATGLHEHAVALANVDKAYGKRARRRRAGTTPGTAREQLQLPTSRGKQDQQQRGEEAHVDRYVEPCYSHLTRIRR